MIRKFKIGDGAQKQQFEMMLFHSVNSIGDLNPHRYLRSWWLWLTLDLGLFSLFPKLSISHSLQFLSQHVEQNVPSSRLVELYPILPNRSSLPSSPSERDATFLLLAISPSTSTLCYQNIIIDYSLRPVLLVQEKKRLLSQVRPRSPAEVYLVNQRPRLAKRGSCLSTWEPEACRFAYYSIIICVSYQFWVSSCEAWSARKALGPPMFRFTLPGISSFLLFSSQLGQDWLQSVSTDLLLLGGKFVSIHSPW
jgi:hypothetical protein